MNTDNIEPIRPGIVVGEAATADEDDPNDIVLYKDCIAELEVLLRMAREGGLIGFAIVLNLAETVKNFRPNGFVGMINTEMLGEVTLLQHHLTTFIEQGGTFAPSDVVLDKED